MADYTRSNLIKYLAISNAATGTLVAAAAGNRIVVLGFGLSWSGTTNLKFQSHVTPTDLTGLFYGAANTNFSSAFCPSGIFATIQGEALDLNNSASVAVGGFLWYVVTP